MIPQQNKAKPKSRKIEFSKFLVVWALITMVACIFMSFLLSILGKDPCTEITTTVITAFVPIAVSYNAKSLGEKHSRNKYGITAEDIINQTVASAGDSGEALG